MSPLKQEIQALYHRADKGASLSELLNGLCQALKNNRDELAGITDSYRLCATDTGYVKAFSLVNGQYVEKTEMDEADVIISGTESNLLAVLKRKLSPASALLRGKIQVKGSMAALLRFGAFLP